ncbi:hypothetical protein QUW13_10670 [Enterococcus hirae]|nr:hypothetical protein [Enterococcus hirae]
MKKKESWLILGLSLFFFAGCNDSTPAATIKQTEVTVNKYGNFELTGTIKKNAWLKVNGKEVYVNRDKDGNFKTSITMDKPPVDELTIEVGKNDKKDTAITIKADTSAYELQIKSDEVAAAKALEVQKAEEAKKVQEEAEQKAADEAQRKAAEEQLSYLAGDIQTIIDNSQGLVVKIEPFDDDVTKNAGYNVLVTQALKYEADSTKERAMDLFGSQIQTVVYSRTSKTPSISFWYSKTTEKMGGSSFLDNTQFKLK